METDYYIASVSFGKDSLAMLLKLIDENKQLNEVVFFDTGMEFNAIYKMRDSLLPLLKNHGIAYTELYPKKPFLYTMIEKPVKGRERKGYGWCGGLCRWGTTEKLKALDKYAKSKNAYVYVGIAYDERNRLSRLENYKIAPLADEWKMTEEQCLQYCYCKGYFWVEENDLGGTVNLYDILDRVSCWCCCNKNLKELKNIYLYLPNYWEKLKEIQTKLERPMKGYYKGTPRGVFELEQKFKCE